jgi:flagellum-specific peptidoglycan hydrolase FlgJ
LGGCLLPIFLLTLGIKIFFHEPVQKYQQAKSFHRILIELDIKYPDVVIAQALHESDLFRSPIFKENHNALGLKCAERRKTYCIGVNRGHAVFRSELECFLDYKEWQHKYLPLYEKRFGKVSTNEEYLHFLKLYKYAEDPVYLRKVKSYFKYSKFL